MGHNLPTNVEFVMPVDPAEGHLGDTPFEVFELAGCESVADFFPDLGL